VEASFERLFSINNEETHTHTHMQPSGIVCFEGMKVGRKKKNVMKE
jgi:hypothetical protein